MLNLEQEIKREKATSLLEDPIGRAIITKITQDNRSIRISDLPLEKLRSISTLARLYKFEDWGILRSELEFKENSCERVFYPTDSMSKLLNINI